MNLSVKANLLQDVSPGAVREIGFRVRTEPIIPGAVLRGALATAWIRNHGIPTSKNTKQAEFIELFEKTVRYSYLYGPGCKVIPLSVQCCKYKPLPGCSTFFLDDAEPSPSQPVQRLCGVCGGPLEASKGGVTVDARADRTRTQLTDDERAEEGNLFSRQVLSKGDSWKGQIAGLSQTLEPHLQTLVSEFVFLGGSKSTLGRAELSLSSSVDPSPPVERSDGRLLLRLTSPGIFLDSFGRPTMDLPMQEVASALGVEPGSISIERGWVRPTTVGGWHAASGLPKPTDWACSPGSTWLIAGVPPGVNLSAITQRAYGFRLAEGHGTLSVNETFSMPMHVSRSTAQQAEQVESVEEAIFGLDDRELRWLVGELKSARVHLEATGEVRTASLNRRTRSYSPEVGHAVKDLLATDRIAVLNRAIIELEGELS